MPNVRPRRRSYSIVLVDVGGTTTRILRKISNGYRVVGKFPSQTKRLRSQLQSMFRKRNLSPQFLLIGMRGVWTKKEKSLWKKKLHKLGPHVSVTSDVELAHWMAFEGGPGIVLIAGTGSIALGRSPSGRWARAGGLGPLLGDEGSGFWIGKEYLKRKKGLSMSPLQLRTWAKDPDAVAKIARLTKKVLHSNSELENRIKDESARHLRTLVESVRKQLRWKGRIPLHLRGGLWENHSFRKKLTDKPPKGFFIVEP